MLGARADLGHTTRNGPMVAPWLSERLFRCELATVGTVAYDEALADRIRELLAADADLSEMKMFGGLSFLVAGHMAVAASGQGGIMVRVDPASSDSLVATTGAQLVEMSGRPMPGWVRVDAGDVRTDPQLAAWVQLGTTCARKLPPKR